MESGGVKLAVFDAVALPVWIHCLARRSCSGASPWIWKSAHPHESPKGARTRSHFERLSARWRSIVVCRCVGSTMNLLTANGSIYQLQVILPQTVTYMPMSGVKNNAMAHRRQQFHDSGAVRRRAARQRQSRKAVKQKSTAGFDVEVVSRTGLRCPGGWRGHGDFVR